ncbi:3-dehydroquinate synthase [Endozoicomonas montiporae]|uniref:3-dehydroquinate synthase n=2 Tax=Endozoicomonas montiporae TaxID=1027273 RepID=A0A081N4B4_9GAMM|nr:3-dehydroquinate synthase [Endozoicomonas montiporae]AMO57872.1 3-dehydroquinate synthase [Endozoicomonas montiporae CL-33]KEQ13287.1 3-dehydroquinate synthase [Endozoicomonas montiporae]
MPELTVDLGDRSYPIFIGSGTLSDASKLTPYIRAKQVAIVTNETIAPLYLNKLKSLLNDFDVIDIVLPDGEAFKNLQTLETVFDGLLQARHNRTTTLIALGGGVVGDMAGFAAACYQRGVEFIQVPTTVLSQVDSSVGGKTGVNHPLGKNMIGAFHQPNAVMIDTDVLGTLPDRELSAGIAEVIKYGLICDPEFYGWLQDNIAKLMARDTDSLVYAIHRSCADKAKVVAEDEKEAGIRAILNLGHTFGHAIETHVGYGEWLHGEAVAAGMVMAAKLSCRLGAISEDQVEQLQQLLKQANLPVLPPEGMTPENFLEIMAVDKKVLDSRLRLVLLEQVGKAVVTSEFDRGELDSTLLEMCSC